MSAAHPLSVVNAAIFDGVSAELAEGVIHIQDGVIVAVDDSRPDGQVIDARGGTVLPGLIDAHFHAYGTELDLLALESSPLSYLSLAGARRLGAALG